MNIEPGGDPAAFATDEQRVIGTQAQAVAKSLQAHLQAAQRDESRLGALLAQLHEQGLDPVDIAILAGLQAPHVEKALRGESVLDPS